MRKQAKASSPETQTNTQKKTHLTIIRCCSDNKSKIKM